MAIVLQCLPVSTMPYTMPGQRSCQDRLGDCNKSLGPSGQQQGTYLDVFHSWHAQVEIVESLIQSALTLINIITLY